MSTPVSFLLRMPVYAILRAVSEGEILCVYVEMCSVNLGSFLGTNELRKY